MEVQTYLDRLKYAILLNSTRINVVKKRQVDQKRKKIFTNRYTLGFLFPNEDEIDAIRRELSILRVEDYIETVKDTRFTNRSEMRVFGKELLGKDVYIKIRVELLNFFQAQGNSSILVMSFHFSDHKFKQSDFPYK